jgi:hypothetical protein
MSKTTWVVICCGLTFMAVSAGAVERTAAPQATLIASVQGCVRAESRACNDLASQLATRMKGVDPTDPALGLKLGTAAARAIEHPEGAVVGVVGSCRAGYGLACASLSHVLDALFVGNDALLERSTDRLLAHDLAATVVADRTLATLALRAR